MGEERKERRGTLLSELFVWCGCLFGGGSLLEYGHLFEKIWDVEFSLT